MPQNELISRIWKQNLFTEGDIVKMLVILSLVMVSLMMTAYALENDLVELFPIIYTIPIILICLWYPHRSVMLTVILVGIFLCMNVYYSVLGFSINVIMSVIYASMFFWVLGATSLFSTHFRFTSSHYERLIANTRDAKFLCEAGSLKILAANSLFADIIEYAPYDLVGIPAETLWADENEKNRFADEMRYEGYIGNLEMNFRTKSGRIHTVLLSCRALLPDNLYECTVVDIGRMKMEQERLIQWNGHLQRLMHFSHDIIFMQGLDGRIIHFYWVNAPEYGLDAEKIVGEMPHTLLGADAAASHLERVNEVLSTKKTISYELPILLNGPPCSLSTILGPMYSTEGDLIGVVGTARDITELKQRKLACMQLEWEIDHWKEFLMTAAHELRTPLQPVIGYLRLILDDPEYYGIDPGTERLLQLSFEGADREREIVDQILEFSLITMDRVDLSVSDIQLYQLIEAVILEGAYRQDAEISNEIPENRLIQGDFDQMCQVLESLISNAVKYNKSPKKIRITYRESNKHHYIQVCDNGIGIPKEFLTSIFRPFCIVGAEKLNRQCGRMGLGLSIAKKYIQMHGGEMTVTSEVGVGSTFTIQIPKEVTYGK